MIKFQDRSQNSEFKTGLDVYFPIKTKNMNIPFHKPNIPKSLDNINTQVLLKMDGLQLDHRSLNLNKNFLIIRFINML